jgi:hypothetical protein
VGVPGITAAPGEAPAAGAAAVALAATAEVLIGTPALGFGPVAAEGDTGSPVGRLEGLPGAIAAAAIGGPPVLGCLDGLAGWAPGFCTGLSEGPRLGFRVERGLLGLEADSFASMGCAANFAVAGVPLVLLPAPGAGPVATPDDLAEPGCFEAPSGGGPRGELAFEGTLGDLGTWLGDKGDPGCTPLATFPEAYGDRGESAVIGAEEAASASFVAKDGGSVDPIDLGTTSAR